jgi:hypothetical protein
MNTADLAAAQMLGFTGADPVSIGSGWHMAVTTSGTDIAIAVSGAESGHAVISRMSADEAEVIGRGLIRAAARSRRVARRRRWRAALLRLLGRGSG